MTEIFSIFHTVFEGPFRDLLGNFAQCENSKVFCIIEILREINFEDSRIAKSAILTQLEALNF